MVLALEAAGTLLLLLALLRRRPGWVAPGVGLVAVGEAVSLALRGPAVLAPALGVALLGSAELAYWSLDAADPAEDRPRLWFWRGLRLLGVVVLGVLAGLAVLTASDLGVGGGFDLTLLGGLAAVALIVGVGWMQRHALHDRDAG